MFEARKQVGTPGNFHTPLPTRHFRLPKPPSLPLRQGSLLFIYLLPTARLLCTHGHQLWQEMILRPSLDHAGRLPLTRSVGISLRSYAHVRPTGKPTFVQGRTEEDSVVPVLIAFAAAFTGTVATLHLLTSSRTTSSTGLRPDRYSKCEVIAARKTSSPSQHSSGTDGEHVYLKVSAPLSKEGVRLSLQGARPGDLRILSVFIKEPSLQIERPYTPLYSDALDGAHFYTPLELLIKRYPDGELGRYAHRLGSKTEVELRGPVVTWQGPQPDHFVLVRRWVLSRLEWPFLTEYARNNRSSVGQASRLLFSCSTQSTACADMDMDAHQRLPCPSVLSCTEPARHYPSSSCLNWPL